MSIGSLRNDIDEHYRQFLRIPLRAAVKERDFIISVTWYLLTIIGMITAAVFLPIKAPPSLFGASLLILVVLISLICAMRVQELYVRLRTDQFADRPQPCERITDQQYLLLKEQQWFCLQYNCEPAGLLDVLRQKQAFWAEWTLIKKRASYDAPTEAFAELFSRPDPSRLTALITALFAMVAAMITLGGSVDSLFEVLEQWRSYLAFVLLITLVIIEVVFCVTFAFSLIKELSISVLEHLNLLPLSDRKVDRFIHRMYCRIDTPVAPPAAIQRIDRWVAFLFQPIRARHNVEPLAEPGHSGG